MDVLQGTSQTRPLPFCYDFWALCHLALPGSPPGGSCHLLTLSSQPVFPLEEDFIRPPPPPYSPLQLLSAFLGIHRLCGLSWGSGKESTCQCWRCERWILVCSLGRGDPLEKEMVTHPTILVWEIHGQRSLEGCSPWDHKELDVAEYMHRDAHPQS